METDLLPLVIASLNDPDTKKRLQEIKAGQDALDDRAKALDEREVALNGREMLLRELHRQGDEKLAAAATRDAELDRREATMREVSEGLNREKAALEKVRANVDAEHKEKESSLTLWQEKLNTDAGEIAARAAELKAREDTVAAYEAKHAAATEHVRNFLDALA